jgi:hypothetical protein
MEQQLLRTQPKSEPATDAQLSPVSIITKMQETAQTVMSFAKNGNGKTRPSKPLKFRFHKDGSISVRCEGHWHHDQELSPALYLSAPAAVRRRIVKQEFETGRPLVSGSPVLLERRDT